MHFRLENKIWEAGKMNGQNKKEMKKLVDQSQPTGVLAFDGKTAIAWAALSPRTALKKLERSRIHKPIDDKPVWSIPCFFVRKNYRMKGISTLFLKEIIRYAEKNNIDILEAYPTIPSQKLPDAFAWVGILKSFEKAGFKIVDRTSANRPMVRYYLK